MKDIGKPAYVPQRGMTTKQELDFIVIGAQKAGTTALFEYLRHHPALSLPPGKYAPYFVDPFYYRLDWPSYLRKTFASADPSNRWGTVTPVYMMGDTPRSDARSEGASRPPDDYTVPLRIHEQVPEVRLIAILRDPVERAFSQYRWDLLQGGERSSFDDVVNNLVRPEVAEQARRRHDGVHPYLVWGEYGRILSPYFDVFDRERILVCFSEELSRAPELVVRRVYEFLGVASDFTPENIAVRYRTGSSRPKLTWLNLWKTQSRWAMRPWARELWHAMPERARVQIDRVFEAAAYREALWNRRNTSDDRPSPATVARLRAYFAEDTRRLATLLDAPLPWEPSPRASRNVL